MTVDTVPLTGNATVACDTGSMVATPVSIESTSCSLDDGGAVVGAVGAERIRRQQDDEQQRDADGHDRRAGPGATTGAASRR